MNNYGYISIGGHYYCSQQSVLRLMLFVALHRSVCPDFVNAKSLIRLLLHRIGLKKYPIVFELNVRGAWCLRVNNGYKVFDPYRAVVTKVYDETTNKPLIAEEIKQQSAIGENSFAPSFLDGNEAESWYQEEMMMGKTGMHFSPQSTRDFMAIYSSEIAPTLVDLIQFHPNTRVTIGDYIEPMPDAIQAEIARISELNAEAGEAIQSFYDESLKAAQLVSGEEVSLVFAHGDFHLFNLFKTNDGVKLTDWEGIGKQSLLFDLFTYFFSHLWTGNSEDSLVDAIDQGVQELANRLEEHNKMLAMDIRENASTYLKLYYIERLYGYATTFQQTPEGFMRWIRIYVEFEKNAAQQQQVGV